MEKSHNRVLSECFSWLWNTYPETRYCCFHVRNESAPERVRQIIIEFLSFSGLYSEKIDLFCKYWLKKHIIQLSQDKAIGIVPGVLDLIWIWDRVYAFDVKVGKDRVSDAQKVFMSAVEKQGGKCFIIGNLDEFKKIVTLIINGRSNR